MLFLHYQLNLNIKKEASEIEKLELFNLLEEYMSGKNNQKTVIEYINTLLKKYPNKYLQESTLLAGEQEFIDNGFEL